MSNENTTVRPISAIAADIRKAWKDKQGRPNVHNTAKPYLDAMGQLEKPTDKFFADDAKTIVIYFLSNAASFKGDDAKRLKAELKKMFGIK